MTELVGPKSPIIEVAQVEVNKGRGIVYGIPVATSKDSRDRRTIALTPNGLVGIRPNIGMVFDNPLEPVHVDKVQLLTSDWGLIKEKTDYTKERVEEEFLKFQEVSEAIVGSSPDKSFDPLSKDWKWNR